MYDIIIEKAAEKFINKQDEPTQTRLLSIIYKLPKGKDIKYLPPRTNWKFILPKY